MKKPSGFTLIELMIAILIGLIVTLAAMTILADSEARRRTQTSVSGVDQSSQYVAYILDNYLRNAGSGFTQSWKFAFGCALNGSNGTTLFPLPALAAPFAGLPAAMGASYRLAPVLIFPGASASGSDILVIAAGSAGFGEIRVPFSSVPNSATLNMTGTTTIRANDLILVADQNSGGNLSPCLLEQASNAFAPGPAVSQVPLSGTYYLASGTDKALADYSADGMAIPLGNASNAAGIANNLPTFVALGVGGNNPSGASTGSALYSLNLLGGTPVTIADGVIELRALYGIDNVGDGLVHAWQAPNAGAYAAATLLNGSAASALLLERIKAIRIGMIVRTNLLEKVDSANGNQVSGKTITLFSDLGAGLAFTRTFNGTNERNYRYRVVESTIPLRNPLLIAN